MYGDDEIDKRRQNPVATVALPATRGPIPLSELERAFQKHHEMIFRTAYRVTGNRTDAEDVLQTVFLRMVRREAPWPPEDRLAQYLHRAAVNGSVDLLRSRQTAGSVPLSEAEAYAGAEPHLNPEQELASTEVRDWLRSWVTRLSSQAGEIFVLRYFEGYSNREIAGLLGTSESTVAVTLFRARERLEKDFRSYMGGEAL
jgi:RNA polymerase sigma-70 factor, ECF subfamily